LEVEQPDKNLHTFNGTLYLDSSQKFSFSADQLLLKGANLANTEWAIGLVTYTGEQTKIMLNSQKGRVKMSHLEGMVNQLVLYIIMA
jgi:phospholipid-transporting ATPase